MMFKVIVYLVGESFQTASTYFSVFVTTTSHYANKFPAL